MDLPYKTTLDGNTMTTTAEPGTSHEGHFVEITDGHMLTTLAMAEQSVADDGQSNTMTMGEVMDVIGVDQTKMDEQLKIAGAVEEMMVVEVDPLGGPLPTYLSAGEDEAVLSPSSGSPMKSVSVTPVTPRRDFLSAVDSSSPAASGLGGGASKIRKAAAASVEDDIEMDLEKKKKVIGRRLAVVEDDGETQMSESSSSLDGEVVTTASSYRLRNKGTKRGRIVEKDSDCSFVGSSEERSSEESRGKKKGKKRKAVKKDSPEEELSDGECGEPRGIVDLLLEEMSSPVLGGSIMQWANRVEEIRVKSRKFQGKLSGEMKKCMGKIKEGTALLVARVEATGDPKVLRLRNSELQSRILEVENENARLKEQLRKLSLGPSPPRRKRKIEKVASGTDIAQGEPADRDGLKGKRVSPVLAREEFPPLPQRIPRDGMLNRKGNGMQHMASAFSTAICDSEGTESVAEAYFTQHINFLTAARDRERERREQQRREQMEFQDEGRGDRLDQRGNSDKRVQEGTRKVGPRIVSDVQVAPPFRERPKGGIIAPGPSGSEAEWRVVSGGGRRGKYGRDRLPSSPLLPPPFFL